MPVLKQNGDRYAANNVSVGPRDGHSIFRVLDFIPPAPRSKSRLEGCGRRESVNSCATTPLEYASKVKLLQTL